MGGTSVKGKSALVTGAGSGINLCFAKALVAKSCNVIVADIGLRPESEEFIASTKGKDVRAVYQKCDVTEWKDLSAAMAATEKEFGSIDIVCPGAGVFEPPFSNFWIPPGTGESADKVENSRYKSVDINITHPIRLTQLAVGHFVSKGKPGNVVNIASIAGQLAVLPAPIYCASKWAVSGFVRSLDMLEPKYGVRVNAVAPGVVKTPLFFDHAEKLKMVDQSKDIWVTPEEVADAMISLIENKDYVGGTILEIGHDHTRVVPQFMNPGPSGPGHAVSNIEETIGDVFTMMEAPAWKKGF